MQTNQQTQQWLKLQKTIHKLQKIADSKMRQRMFSFFYKISWTFIRKVKSTGIESMVISWQLRRLLQKHHWPLYHWSSSPLKELLWTSLAHCTGVLFCVTLGGNTHWFEIIWAPVPHLRYYSGASWFIRCHSRKLGRRTFNRRKWNPVCSYITLDHLHYVQEQ